MDLKLLLKRGALLAAANWPTIAIQFVAQTTFQVLIAVPVIGAAILVAVLLGGDLAELLRGNLREIFTAIASALMSKPAALVSFNARLFRRYLALGLALMLMYGLSIAAYLAFVVYGYRVAGHGVLVLGWAFLAALAAVALIGWMTVINLVYLLLQIAMAVDDVGVKEGARATARFIVAAFRDLAGVFAVVLALVIAATLASALAWSGVGLIAFVPLVGLAVIPLQVVALLLRGLIFEYIGITALGVYVTLYRRHVCRQEEALGRPPLTSIPLERLA